MTTDLWYLVAAVVLAMAQIGLASSALKQQVGNAWTVGPRDEPKTPMGMAGRMERASRNMLDSLVLFAIAVLVVHVSGHANDWSALGAALYFWGRVAYVAAYASGLPWIRTVIWQASMIGIVIVMAQLFF